MPKGRRSGGGSHQKGHCDVGELTHNSPIHFPAFLGKILYHTNLQDTHQLFLLVYERIPKRKPSFDRGGGHLQELNRSKISGLADINTIKDF